MNDLKSGLFENFAIKNWYRYLLYMGGVILVLSMFLEPKGITISQVRTFSIHTINLSLVIWIAKDIYYSRIGWKDDDRIGNWVLLNYAITVMGLLYWIYYIVPIIY